MRLTDTFTESLTAPPASHWNTEAMTTRTQQTNPRRWVLLFLAALVAVLATILSAATASAATTGVAQTRVGASAVAVEILVGPPEHIRAGQRLGNYAAGHELMVATGVAAKTVDEAAALVRYDAMAASRNLLGQVGEGYARTPSGYTVSAHAAERIVFGAPGRSPTTLSRVDDILNNPTRTMMRDNGTIRVYQGKDWVAVRDTGPMHIVTVMVR